MIIKILEQVDRTKILDKVSEHFGTLDSPYEGPSFILPDGSFLDIRSLQNHADVEFWLYQNGFSIVSDFNKRSGSPTLKELGCIRVDTPKYYIQLPEDNLKSAQYSSLKDWFDLAMVLNVPFVEVIAPGVSPVRYKFDDEVDSRYIIDRIRRYYITGNLYESAKEDID